VIAKTDILEIFQFLFKPCRYKALYGGRGGGKSHAIAEALLILGAQNRHRILCTREFQTSIKDSVHKLLTDKIEALGLSGFYRVTQNQILGKNGTEFIFTGLRLNSENVKSTEGVTIAWVEEGQSVSEASWNVLIPTVRKEGSEIWTSWNPDQKSDPVYRRFIDHPPPDSKVVEVGWADNPWLSDEMIAEKDYLYSVDSDAAAHVWGGKTRQRSKAQVLHGKWVVESFEPKKDWSGPHQGADWGFSTDPTTLVRMWVSGVEGSLERDLYIEHEAYGVGVDNDDLPQLFDSVPDARKYITRADNARPETISHMKKHGYPNMKPCKKWSGSVEDGIQHLRGYKRIIIHPRCRHAIDEARLYSYKTDRLSGDVLPVIIDKHNHIWDAARYGLGPLVKSRTTSIDPSFKQNETKNPWKC